MNRDEQEFDEAVSEVGSGLLLVAGFGLLIPSAFFNSLFGGVTGGTMNLPTLEEKTLTISRATSIILMVAFGIYVYFQMRYLDRSHCRGNAGLQICSGAIIASTTLFLKRTN